VRQHTGLRLVRFALENVVARELVLGALQLAIGDRRVLQLLHLRDQRVGDVLGLVPRLDDRHRIKEVGILDQVRLAERRDRHLRFVDQLLVDARALAVGEHLGGDVQRIRIRIAVEGDVIGDDDGRKRPRLLQRDALLLGLRRLLRDVARHDAVRFRHAPHVVVHQLNRLRRIEVADQDEASHSTACRSGRIARRPPTPLRDRPCCDRRVLVGMHRERLVVDDLVQPARNGWLSTRMRASSLDDARSLVNVSCRCAASPCDRPRATGSSAGLRRHGFPNTVSSSVV
jgi:hypothetical protein